MLFFAYCWSHLPLHTKPSRWLQNLNMQNVINSSMLPRDAKQTCPNLRFQKQCWRESWFQQWRKILQGQMRSTEGSGVLRTLFQRATPWHTGHWMPSRSRAHHRFSCRSRSGMQTGNKTNYHVDTLDTYQFATGKQYTTKCTQWKIPMWCGAIRQINHHKACPLTKQRKIRINFWV